MNDNHICKNMIKQQPGNRNVSFSKHKKKEELIPFGKLTQPILKEKADPLMLANMARLEVHDLRNVIEEKEE